MNTEDAELRWMGTDDGALIEAAGTLFDSPPRDDWVQRFLREPNHHLCIAYVDGRPAGFVSGVEMAHPDKGVEMFLYELGVDEAFRGQGLGAALVGALVDRARNAGCYGMWVLTEPDNRAALATYAAAGANDRSDEVMLGWRLDEGHVTFK